MTALSRHELSKLDTSFAERSAKFCRPNITDVLNETPARAANNRKRSLGSQFL